MMSHILFLLQTINKTFLWPVNITARILVLLTPSLESYPAAPLYLRQRLSSKTSHLPLEAIAKALSRPHQAVPPRHLRLYLQ
jgi:hypothetical protein